MTTYKAVHLAQRPCGPIVPGVTFRTEEHPVPQASELKDGEVILKTLQLSLDPAMRGWIDGVRFAPVPSGESLIST